MNIPNISIFIEIVMSTRGTLVTHKSELPSNKVGGVNVGAYKERWNEDLVGFITLNGWLLRESWGDKIRP